MANSSYRPRVLDVELDELSADLAAISLEGAKAVGKTATATQRATTVFDLDNPDQRAVAEADLDRLIASPPPILFDEWQYLPPVWDKVRRAVDAGAPPGQFLLAGSASPDGLGTHSGAGRIVSLRMRPLSLAERIEDSPSVSLTNLLSGERGPIKGATQVKLEDYTDEILRSGFPGFRGLGSRALRAQLESYISRIVDRDFPELRPVRNPAALRRWMTAYAAATATTTTFEKIRDASSSGQETRPARSTVTPYRDVLERLFILDPVPGWKPTLNHLSQLTLPPKHHLADPALAASLLGASAEALLDGQALGPPIPRDGSLLGALFESLVTLSVRVYARPAEASVAHLRTINGDREIDLIVERGDGRIVAIEVKLASSPPESSIRHLKWLKDRMGPDLLDAIIVTTGTDAYRREDGIGVVPAALLGP